MNTLNQSTDLTKPDADMLSFWLGLPTVVRYLIVIVGILGAGWTARGTFTEWMGVEARVTTLEKDMVEVKGELLTSTKRQDAMLLYLMCRAAEIDAKRSPVLCQYYVKDYPEILAMVQGAGRQPIIQP